MKKLILIGLMVVFEVNLFAQTKVDKLIFDKINAYREANGVKALNWEQKGSIYSTQQSKIYLQEFAKTEAFVHIKDTKIDSIGKLINRQDIYKVKILEYKDIFNSLVFNYYPTDDSLAEIIFKEWKLDENDNKIMLSEEFYFGGIGYSELYLHSYTEGNTLIYGPSYMCWFVMEVYKK